MDESKYTISTKMTKEDYHKFIYVSTFCRNKFSILIMFIVALIVSFCINYGIREILDYSTIMIYAIIYFIIAILFLVLKLEYINRSRIKTDKTGTFDSTTVLNFYNDKFVFESESLKSRGELKYVQIFSLVETKDYFVFYITSNQASIIRKKDINNVEEFKKFLIEKFKGNYKKI